MWMSKRKWETQTKSSRVKKAGGMAGITRRPVNVSRRITIAGVAAIFVLLIFTIPRQYDVWGTTEYALELKNPHLVSSLLYACPANAAKALNDNESYNLTAFYNSDAVYLRDRLATILQLANKSLGEPAFNALEFDKQERGYMQVKEILHDWKVSQFSKYVKSNMSIYESACGEGFNLLMTLSILYETAGVTNVTVYGNEYRSTGVTIANELLRHMAQKVMPGSHLGQICQGDSSNLYFVPSHSFDVAFTGYIDPIEDSYGFFVDIPFILKRQAWYEVCNAHDQGDEEDPESMTMTAQIDKSLKTKIAQLDQRRQEDWFASWVSELIRIVKPGGAVIIEQVAWPKCMHLDDYGGVRKSWWKLAISKYGWDVEEKSLHIEDMTTDDRYHVSMQKRK